MLSEFTDVYRELPAKMFISVCEATEFTHLLNRLGVSYRVKLVTAPKRLKLPMQTIVILLEEESYGTCH